MDDVDWLRGLGLEQYAAAFEQNHIEPGLLPSLTAEDLRGRPAGRFASEDLPRFPRSSAKL